VIPESFFQEPLRSATAQLKHVPRGIVRGRLRRVTGLLLEIEGLRQEIGSRVCVQGSEFDQWIEAECVGFTDEVSFCMAFDPVVGAKPGASVYPFGAPFFDGRTYKAFPGSFAVPIGDNLLGRVVDGLGRPLDGRGGAVPTLKNIDVGLAPNPLRRRFVSTPFETGIRAIDSVLTLGRGQRVGIFSGSGVGKSVLIAMLCKYCIADVIVIALVGERSREIREFYEHTLSEEARGRSVLVTAPADTSPLARARGAEYAAEVARHFREQGKNVVLIVDSLTRYAIAWREIALSMGEPPVTRGYPPSVFARLSTLVEQAGNGENESGSITALYSVLLDSEDSVDPIADAARGVLDGHLFLSRLLANSGHYPAIDIERSVSRVMPSVVTAEHFELAASVRRIVSKYFQSRDLLSMGAYVQGVDRELDTALRLWPSIEKYLRQGLKEKYTLTESIKTLRDIMGHDVR